MPLERLIPGPQTLSKVISAILVSAFSVFALVSGAIELNIKTVPSII